MPHRRIDYLPVARIFDWTAAVRHPENLPRIFAFFRGGRRGERRL